MKYFPVVSPRVSRYEPARRAAWEQSRPNISPCAAHCIYFSMTVHWDLFRLMRVYLLYALSFLRWVGCFFIYKTPFSTKNWKFVCVLAVHDTSMMSWPFSLQGDIINRW